METPTLDTTHIGFLLLPGFSMLALSCALEPLQVANELAGRPLYRIQALTQDEAPLEEARHLPVDSSTPLAVQPCCSIHAFHTPLDVLMVVGGRYRQSTDATALFNWLRQQARAGVMLGGIATGTQPLAEAGLLDGYRAALHWQRADHFGETYPKVIVTRNLFELDRQRMTCGGGTASMDMMVTWIGARYGKSMAASISEHFVMERIRLPDEPQHVPLKARLSHAPTHLRDAVAMMEANISEPLSTDELAHHLGISRRQLERLFRQYLDAMPSRYYLNLRLQQAQRLLRETAWSIGEVALRAGFTSASHFTTRYRNHFGYPPREERQSTL